MTEQTARAAEETAREVAHPWCVDDGNCEEDASSNDHSAECDMLTEQIVAAIQSERTAADRRVREAEKMVEAAAQLVEHWPIENTRAELAAAIRALKSPTPTGGERG